MCYGNSLLQHVVTLTASKESSNMYMDEFNKLRISIDISDVLLCTCVTFLLACCIYLALRCSYPYNSRIPRIIQVPTDMIPNTPCFPSLFHRLPPKREF